MAASTTTTHYLPLYAESGGPNRPTVSGWGDGGFVEVFRANPGGRRKPVNLIASSTNVLTQVQDIKHSVFRYYRAVDGYYEDRTSASLSGLLLHLPTDDILVKARAISRNRLLAIANSRSVNFAQLLSEYRKTASLFQDLSKRIVGSFRSLRKRNFNKLFPGDTYAPSKDWLAFQYGIRPLFLDMHGAMKDLQGVEPPSEVIKASSSLFDSDTSYTQFYDRRLTASRFSSVQVRSIAELRLSASGAMLLSSRYGFSDPLALAWEITPWSLVVDWWLNIGGVLSSFSNMTAILSLQGPESVIVRRVNSFEGGHNVYLLKQRSLTSYPLVETLVFNDKTSLQRILNGLALWRSSRH